MVTKTISEATYALHSTVAEEVVPSLNRDPEEHDEPRYENCENSDSARETRSLHTASKSSSSAWSSCRGGGGGAGDGG